MARSIMVWQRGLSLEPASVQLICILAAFLLAPGVGFEQPVGRQGKILSPDGGLGKSEENDSSGHQSATVW
jgi:hypothetical protein